MKNLLGTIHKVKIVFRELDKEIELFSKKSTLKCLDNCGECCNSKQIEATICDALPVAYELYKNNDYERFFENSTEELKTVNCLLFSLNKNNGCCTYYNNRPLICRLFGFSGQINKYKQKDFSCCKWVKKQNPKLNSIIKEKITSGELVVPIMTKYSAKINECAPELSQNFYYINVAIRKALERIAFWEDLTKKERQYK